MSIPDLHRSIAMRCKSQNLLKLAATLVFSTICVYLYVYHRRERTQISSNSLNEVTSRSVDEEWKTALERSNGKDNERVHRLPDVIGIGIQKCGTGALRHFLSYHPYVRALSGEAKFFNRADNRAKGLRYYREMLPAALPHELIFEKTPAYYTVKDLPKYLRHILPKDAKLILLICDPTKRALSHFGMQVEEFGGKNESFDDFVQRNIVKGHAKPNTIIRRGIYHERLQSWMRSFGSNLLILDGELLLEDPATAIKTVQKFLNIPVLITEKNFIKNSTTGLFCFRRPTGDRNAGKCVDSGRKGRTRSKTARYTLSNWSSKILRSFYREHNEKLYKILGRNYGW